nr:M48 family metallopeptidase [Cylindrospermum stagnale]
MALNPEQFDTLVSRLESFARQQPAIYKLRVFLLAALGYAYIFGTLAGLFTVLIAITVIMWQIEAFYSVAFLLWYLVILGVMVVPILVVWRSLWVFFPPPQGLTLQRQDVPDLFALVDKLTTKLKVPRFHHILLTEEFNAGVIQRPRWGLLGWQQNYLLLGLPLMQGLSPQEFTAVVAHELGHLSGNHSLVNGWIYRVQKIYSQLFAQLDIIGNQIVLVIFARFLNGMLPFLVLIHLFSGELMNTKLIAVQQK